MKREIAEIVTGHPTVDGAGVNLVRVLGPDTVYRFDPFLMLDAFDSCDPEDYILGFPTHPHRGIETFTYLIKGRIEHQDSLGNKGIINDGECQWMTGGSGILHQEMPQPVEHMLGLQLWINLAKEDKMTPPKYMGITPDMIKIVKEPDAEIKVVAGKYKDHQGIKGHHVDATVLDIMVYPDREFSMKTVTDNTLFVYILEGSGSFGEGDQVVSRKRAILFSSGDEFTVNSGSEGIRFILATAAPLGNPIAWGGPIVMNTREELQKAFEELREGTFIKEDAY